MFRRILVAGWLALPVFVTASEESDARARAALAIAAAQQKAAPKAAPPVAVVVVESPYILGWHKLQPGERTVAGWHWHNDGEWWIQHGPENNGNKRAHTSPLGNVKFDKSPAPCPH